jgi:hypothetical protein
MSERSWGKVLFGGVIGLILGVVLGADRVMENVSTKLIAPPAGADSVGWNAPIYLRSPEFWLIVVFCTLVFAFIAGRIGRPTHHSDL